MTKRKTPWLPGPYIAEGEYVIASYRGYSVSVAACVDTDVPAAKRRAQATLFAAAPTMAEKAEAVAEAMQEALAALNGGPNTEGLHEQCEAALSDLKAALAAAKGGDA